MIIPQYWAEGRVRQRTKEGQFTARRFGWSDTSQAEAQAMADQRAQEALARLLAGERIARLEPKVAYNGAEGVPIREEIVRRHGDAIETRNLYGARCLNHPDVLFADIDFDDELSYSWIWVLAWGGACVGAAWLHPFIGYFVGILAGMMTMVILGIVIMPVVRKLWSLVLGTSEERANKRIAKFVQDHPDWHLRLYRTPAGFRLLALQRTFNPGEPAVAECFRALGVDPLYAKMCRNQQCFRARVSPKPWRIGIAQHLRPRPGVWPVKPEHLPERARWIGAYEQTARNFAACRLVADLGSGAVDPRAAAVQAIHDDLSRAGTTLPIA